MRKDIKKYIEKYTKKEFELLNKSEIARRFNCDPRTVDRYMKIQTGTLKPKKRGKYKSMLDDFKSTIENKIDVHGATAMATYKFI